MIGGRKNLLPVASFRLPVFRLRIAEFGMRVEKTLFVTGYSWRSTEARIKEPGLRKRSVTPKRDLRTVRQGAIEERCALNHIKLMGFA